MIPDHLTPENLAAWIKEHNVERRNFTMKIEYSEEEIAVFEHKLSERTITLEELEKQKASVNECFAKGTDERAFTIPETIGIKSLKGGISNLAEKIKVGFEETIVDTYGIPNHETKEIVFVDIEGIIKGNPREMNAHEIDKYTGPLFDGTEANEEDEPEIEIESVNANDIEVSQEEMQQEMDEGAEFEDGTEIDTSEFPDVSGPGIVDDKDDTY